MKTSLLSADEKVVTPERRVAGGLCALSMPKRPAASRRSGALALLLVGCLCAGAPAQVNSGSNGSDGVFAVANCP